MSVLAPGQGENLTTGGTGAASTLTAQLGMYEQLANRVDDLTTADLASFYKAMDLKPLTDDEVARVDNPRLGVRVMRDRLYAVPRVIGVTRRDAMFGVGYAQAQSLLWQMEVNKRTWRAMLATLMGPGAGDENLAADGLLFRVLDYSDDEYRTMYEHLRTHGLWGRTAYEDIQAYVDGINAYIDAVLTHKEPVPVEFQQRGVEPTRWSPQDVVASSAWSHVRGQWRAFGPREAGNALLLRRLREKWGKAAGDAVYADLRDSNDPETPSILSPAGRPKKMISADAPGVALLDLGSLVARSATVERANASDRPFVSEPPSKSNALLVSGSLSATGHPISVQGPQDGYGAPHGYDFEIQINAPDFEARGSLESEGPYPYNGARAREFAFSGTAQYIDQFDMFAEALCEPQGSKPTLKSTHYLYRGRCIPLQSRDVERLLPGGGSYTLQSLRSVHGPIVAWATVDGRAVALSQARSTFLHEELDFPPLAEVFVPSRVKSAHDFVRVMSRASRQLAFYYIDRNDIAFVNPGLVPLRADTMRSDLPAWGTGAWDWQKFDPQAFTFRKLDSSRLPSVVNPPDGVIAGWNNQPGEQWPMSDGMWIAGPGHRVSLLKDAVIKISQSRPVTLDDVVKVHTLAGLTDVRAHFAYPVVRRVIGSDELPDGLRAPIAELDDWMRNGALRRESSKHGTLDHGAAITLFDAWWPALLRSIFEPVLGRTILDEAGGNPNNLSSLNTGPGAISGWIGYLSKDLRSLLGEAVPGRFSRQYCGEGNLTECRVAILASLDVAVRRVRATYGGDFLTRDYPVTCPTCVQITFSVTGAGSPVEAIPWQNRPTFELVTSYH